MDMSDKDNQAEKIVKKNKRLAPLVGRSSRWCPWWALRNSAGKKDVAMTLMIVAFMFSLLLAGLGAIENINLGNQSFNFRSFDMGFATTVLVPLVGLYFGRRWTDTNRGLYDHQSMYLSARKSDDLEQPE